MKDATSVKPLRSEVGTLWSAVASVISGRRGMRPAVPGAHPLPLEPNQLYRLFVRSGKMKGQRDFSLGPPALAAEATNAPAATPQ